MISVKKLYEDLDYWIMIGIADDIVTMPEQRKEYQQLVQTVKKTLPGCPSDEIPHWCLRLLSYQLERPLLFRQTLYWILWLEIKKYWLAFKVGFRLLK